MAFIYFLRLKRLEKSKNLYLCSMKILHTADWHIGKRLHGYDLRPDHELFFSWLLQVIKEEEIDVLLVAGDVFDIANPTNESRELYYHFLKNIIGLNCQVVITGGNHDSPAMLNAPAEVLSLLNIQVIGKATQPIDNELIELKKDGNLKAIVAAVPYLREGDIRQNVAAESYAERIKGIQEGIKNHYETLAERIEKRNLEVPAIAMGHLFAVNSERSESERDIQVGNQAAVASDAFSPLFQYVALGHIHQPQKVGGLQQIQYSGSPIALSFSEREQQKQVIILTIESNKISEISPIHVPTFRRLIRIVGTFEEVQKAYLGLENDLLLPILAELQITEKNADFSLSKKVQEELVNLKEEQKIVLLYKVNSENTAATLSTFYDPTQQLAELTEMDVFEKIMAQNAENTSEEDKILLKNTYQELLEMVSASY